MNSRKTDLVVCCNGASPPKRSSRCKVLEYEPSSSGRNITLGLPDFIAGVYHIPDRLLDLLEIAAYTFAADRLITRGPKDQVEYQSWSRRWLFRIRVRDHAFWSRSEVSDALRAALKYMTGDMEYRFNFLPGHRTPPASLFDSADFSIDSQGQRVRVTLFSGGLDSLAGALKILDQTSDHLVLVSHESQTGTMRTQQQLVRALDGKFPRRLSHYRFLCHLRGERAVEETQRTRSFLYCSIGFAIARAYGLSELEVYENGVTSINLHRREDLANARASRTTHPRTMKLLEKFFGIVAEQDFRVTLPFLWSTKRGVIEGLCQTGRKELIASTVSCSRTFQRLGDATHCGRCFQCIDRRIAIHAAGAEAADDRGLYALDVFRAPIDNREDRTTAIDYVRQATALSNSNVDYFSSEYLVEIGDVVDALESGGTELERIEAIWRLMAQHASDVRAGLGRARDLYDDLFKKREAQSLLGLVADREHLKDEVKRCVTSLLRALVDPLREILARKRPADEPELNNLVGGILRSHELALRSEHPSVSFAGARVIPDHDLPGMDIFIEAKFIRAKTSPSRASEGMAADLTKYPQTGHILFLVYDPDRAIVNDVEFIRDFERHGRCTVQLIR